MPNIIPHPPFKIKIIYVNDASVFPFVVNEMAVMLYFVIYFWHLEEWHIFYTPRYKYLKAVSRFLFSHLECLPVCCPDTALQVWLSICWLFSFKEMEIPLLIKSQQMHTANGCMYDFSFLKVTSICLKKRNTRFHSLQSCRFCLESKCWSTRLFSLLKQWSLFCRCVQNNRYPTWWTRSVTVFYES